MFSAPRGRASPWGGCQGGWLGHVPRNIVHLGFNLGLDFGVIVFSGIGSGPRSGGIVFRGLGRAFSLGGIVVCGKMIVFGDF